MTPHKQTGNAGSPQESFAQTTPSYTEAFTVVAGTGTHKGSLLAYTSTLCRDSSYFQKSCSERWSNPVNKTIRIKEFEFETFDLYYHWKLFGNIDLERIRYRDEHEINKALARIQALLKLYITADYFEDGSLLINQVMDELILQLEWWKIESPLALENIPTYVWANTSPESKLRRFVVDSCATTATQEALKDETDFPTGFLKEILLRTIDFRGKPIWDFCPRVFSHCQYHVHKGESAAADKVECTVWAERQHSLAAKKRRLVYEAEMMKGPPQKVSRTT
ncbi:Ankyrin repeat and BTB/POZ domain-containing protein 1 [Elasticomyces elasticus]|nr:Ankyrin repeat and BTB/POZ domain-containing protein 1 [Elasticomyces elasticus]